MTVTRREVLKGAAATVSVLALSAKAMRTKAEDQKAGPRLKVLITGGHPGDPECGCGGVAARYAELGHEVTLLYLNRGELYCGDHPREACGAVRTQEAEKACAILKARAAFAAQTDGQAIVDVQHYAEFQKLYVAQGADVVFTQWPTDEHRDHRAMAALVLDAWMQSGRKAALYYYEVAEDTSTFAPSVYVDISAVAAVKKAACFAHASQGPEKWYPLEEAITRKHGAERGCAQAEGFVRHALSRDGILP